MKKRILIVDDCLENRRIMEMYFSMTGFSIGQANNGQEAVDLFNQEAFDAVLLDLHMPVMGGYEAAKMIKKISPDCPIFITSGDSLADCDDSSVTDKKDYDAYFRKPFDYNLMAKTLSSFI